MSSFQQKISWTFGKKNAVCFSELHSTCPGTFLRRNISEGDDFLKIFVIWANHLVIWGEVFMAFNKHFTLGFSKLQFTGPRKQIEDFFGKSFGLSIYSVFWPKYFWFLGKKTFAKVCQNCILRVQMKSLGIFFLKKPCFSVIFANWAEKFRTFAKHLRQGFQNINLSVQGIFSRKTFKKLIIFSVVFFTLR